MMQTGKGAKHTKAWADFKISNERIMSTKRLSMRNCQQVEIPMHNPIPDITIKWEVIPTCIPACSYFTSDESFFPRSACDKHTATSFKTQQGYEADHLLRKYGCEKISPCAVSFCFYMFIRSTETSEKC